MRELNEMLSQSKVVGKIYGKIYRSVALVWN